MSYGPTPGDAGGYPPAGPPPGFGGQVSPQDPTVIRGQPGAPAEPGAPGQYGDPAQFGMPGQYGVPGQYGSPPPSYRAWAIAAMIGGVLFNLILGFPMGLAASRQSRQVRNQWAAGNPQAAVTASRKARNWAIASTVFDLLGLVLVIGVVANSASTANSQSNYHNPAVVSASIKSQLQQRLSNPSSPYYSPGVKVTSVVCTASGQNTDSCVDQLSNGQTVTETAVISADGLSYRTK